MNENKNESMKLLLNELKGNSNFIFQNIVGIFITESDSIIRMLLDKLDVDVFNLEYTSLERSCSKVWITAFVT